jgi:hypothetical protein
VADNRPISSDPIIEARPDGFCIEQSLHLFEEFHLSLSLRHLEEMIAERCLSVSLNGSSLDAQAAAFNGGLPN